MLDLELRLLGALEFGVWDGIGFEATEFGDGELDDFEGPFGGGAGVDGEHAGVAEGVRLRVDGVGGDRALRGMVWKCASSCRRRAWC